jgi:hypothetical protein
MLDKMRRFRHWTRKRPLSHCGLNPGVHVTDTFAQGQKPKSLMFAPVTRSLRPLAAAALLLGATLLGTSLPALSQAPEQKPADPKAAPGGPAADQKKIDEFAEAIRVLGGPAANPECVWLGRRVVNLMWRDDLDTAFRHLDLYDRFGCPGGHIQAAFRCLVRQGQIDPKALESLGARVHACWINPTMEPPPAAPAAAAAPAGTKPQ